MPSNAYMREYMKKRYHRRRASAIRFLGGKCIKCGSTKRLEFDHKKRTTKEFAVGRVSSASEKRWWREIKKCQLLCNKCHTLKTIIEVGNKIAKGKHGTLSSYTYCHCDKCREAKNKWAREYRARIRSLKNK